MLISIAHIANPKFAPGGLFNLYRIRLLWPLDLRFRQKRNSPNMFFCHVFSRPMAHKGLQDIYPFSCFAGWFLLVEHHFSEVPQQVTLNMLQQVATSSRRHVSTQYSRRNRKSRTCRMSGWDRKHEGKSIKSNSQSKSWFKLNITVFSI